MSLTFTGGALDRAAEHRGDLGWLAAQASDPAARAVLANADGIHVVDDRVRLVPLNGLADPMLLGLDADGPVFAVEAPAGTDVTAVREAAAVLPAEDAGLAAYAAALLNWHRRHRHCSVCGTPTTVGEGGILRRCPNCGAQHHPRTDPVVITLVTDGDRVLLGRNANWPERRFSCLAGFVEPGESLEEAVAREVGEEAGVTVAGARYVSSQPWPFPASLMLGFEATYTGGDPHPHDRELQAVAWFTREDLRRAAAGDGEVSIPPPLAIARRLMDGWLRAGD